MRKFGGLHVLFGKASTAIEGTVEKLSEADCEKTFAINEKSIFLCSK